MMLHGRQPIPSIFPVSLWRNDFDVSDPYTFLFLKRGILRMVILSISICHMLTLNKNTCK